MSVFYHAVRTTRRQSDWLGSSNGTNTVERAIRPLCLNGKNALFASGDDGGRSWADLASLIETCKLNGVDPQRYLTELLNRLVDAWPNSRVDEFTPWRWIDAIAP